MDTKVKAPFLSRVKSWQLVGLGLSGWFTLYSVAILTWGASSAFIGNAQGGCFAITMTLAGVEAKRYRKGGAPAGAMDWITGVPTEHLNQTLAQVMQKLEFRVEPCQPNDADMGFGVRAINAGRTMVFETNRWQEPVIDLHHAQTTEENRKKARADLAIIVSAGKPDDAARTFVQTRPVKFLIGKEFKTIFNDDNIGAKKA